MSGIGEAASVIAVTQISGKVISLCTQYSKKVRNARDDIDKLRSSIENARVVLEGISRLLGTTDAHGQRLEVSQRLSPALLTYQSRLQELHSRLERDKGHKLMSRWGLRALKWPFKSKEIEQFRLEIEKYEHTFTHALQVDQTALLLDADKKTDANSQNAALGKLPNVAGAAYDTHEEEYNSTCLPETRVELQEEIQHWVADPDGKNVYWLNGMAGTGKSTIARTMATAFAEQGILGASFFFKRGAGDRGSASRFFTTIAWQLANKFPDLAIKIAEAISVDANLPNRSFKEQLDQLILQPLCRPSQRSLPKALLLVVDALDECENDEDIRTIVKLLALSKDAKSTSLRILLTSRPDLPIRLGFNKLEASAYDKFVLHEIAVDTVEHDIALFLRHEFDMIRETHEIDAAWPGEAAIVQLARLAVPLFIFAATVCRYLRDPADPPRKQLEYFLNSTAGSEASGMDKTYLPVLHQVLDGRSQADQAQITRDFRQTVGAIVLLASPLSRKSLATLLQISEEDISFRLRRLHSVLDIPSNLTKPIRLFHLSFREFLLDSAKKDLGPFSVDKLKTHRMLTNRCIALLSTSPCLQQDICGKHESGISRHDYDEVEIEQALPQEVQYACRYWVHHLKSSVAAETGPPDLEPVWHFLSCRFLYWLEALSLLGHARESIAMVEALQMVLQAHTHTELSDFVGDAKRFILQNLPIIEQAPLQLYSSAIIFAPENSPVRRQSRHLLPRWIDQKPLMETDWSACLQTLEGHSERVTSVAFSPLGQIVASGSDDQTIKLWDISAGSLRITLKGHSKWVSSVAFSPSGQMLASGSHDSTVKLWDPSTGALYRTLEDPSQQVTSVAFSPDGQTIASVSSINLEPCRSDDNTVKLWDVSTGSLCHTLNSHSIWIFSVAFSPDGKIVASGSQDSTIKLWDASTGALSMTIEDESQMVPSVAFSTDGQILASGSSDASVKFWDISTGALRSTLEGHLQMINSVAFSRDGQTVASGSVDSSVQLWDISTGAPQRAPDFHLGYVTSVAFSPDGQVVGSGSYDQTVKLWDTSTRSFGSSLGGHSQPVILLAVSPDGKSVASASEDAIIKLWDASTGALCMTIDDDSAIVKSMAFSPDGNMLASGSINRMLVAGIVVDKAPLKLWDVSTGALHITLDDSLRGANTFAFSPDGQLVASGSDDQTVKLWDISTGALHTTLEDHSSVSSVAFAPSGRIVASGSKRKVRLWDASTGAEIRMFDGHKRLVTSIAFSVDGHIVASGSLDQTIKLWSASTGQVLCSLETGYPVYQISFSEGGSLLQSNWGTFRMWSTLKNHAPPDHTPHLTSPSAELAIDAAWISWKGRKLLWLPPEYRGNATAVHDSKVVLGRSTGHVTFISFNRSFLPY